MAERPYGDGMTRTWFITGAASGFGLEWAQAALERGEDVTVTARGGEARFGELLERHGDHVLALDLDVRDRDAVFAAVRRAHEHFGRLDVVVNSAGIIHFGMVEELTEAEVRAQLDVNLLGPLWVTQAVLPILTEQASGHLLQVTSEGGVLAYPGVGAYHASKWALEGLTESLVQELEGTGVAVTLVEPGPYATGLGGSAQRSAELPAYDGVRAAASFPPYGDPAATRDALFALLDADEPPRRLMLGAGRVATVTAIYEERLAAWRAWEPVSEAAQG
jgi:NAD(P)-dependent dehydrogenase (short-subunit alcohol dehydrogenase family)